MIVSGVGASPCATRSEDARQPIDRGHRHRRPGRDFAPTVFWPDWMNSGFRVRVVRQAFVAVPQSNSVPSVQMQCRMIASLRAIATLAFFRPTRFTSR